MQRFVGKELDTAWPSDEPLPQITGPLHETAAHNLDEARAERLAWLEAFPQPAARRDGDRLLAWYGPQSAPALSLPPIPLDRP